MCEDCGCEHDNEKSEIIDVGIDVLAENKKIAAHNRDKLSKFGIVMINLVGSPGSGKTTLLEKTLPVLKDKIKVSVIEGDLETDNDKTRIDALDVPCYQIKTHGACHLDAEMVHKALHKLELNEALGLIFIENVGNLICPALFALGEDFRVIVLSVPEGDDKPEKYPEMFYGSDVVVISKMDLIPYVDFDIEKCRKSIMTVNPKTKIIQFSAKTDEGLNEWMNWLEWAIKKPT